MTASIRNLMVRLGVEVDDRGSKKFESSLSRMSGQVKGFGMALGLAFGASTIVDFARDSIKAASDLSESMSKANVVFGKSSAAVIDFSSTAALAMGQSKQQALEAAGTFGNLFVSMKIGQPQAAKMSTSLVTLASDLASFNNTSPTEALDALRSGLVGETEPLRRFGINLDDAQLRAESMRLGLGKIGPTLTPLQKSQAAYSLILKQSTTAQGDFTRTAGGLANQQRILTAQFDDAKASLGEALLPVMLSVVRLFNNSFIPGLRDSIKWAKENSDTIKTLAIAVGIFLGALAVVKVTMIAVNTATKISTGLTLAWAAATRIANGVTGGFSRGIGTISSAWETMRLKSMYAADAVREAGGPLKALNQSIGGISGAASKAKAGLGNMVGMLGGPWGIAITAAIGAITWFATRNDEAEARVSGLTDAIKEDSGVLGTNTRAKIVNTLQTQGLLDLAQKAGISTKLFTDAVMGQGTAMSEVDRQLQSMARNTVIYGGRAGQGTLATKELTGAGKELFDGLHGGNAELKEAQRKQNQLNEALGVTKVNGLAAAGSIDYITDASTSAASAADKLNAKLSKFNSLAGDADMAAIDFRNTIDEMTKSFKDNGLALNSRTGAFNLNSRKGRDNNKMLIEAIRAAGDHSEKVLKQTGSVDKANSAFKREIAVIREVLSKHGASRTSIDRLIAKYVDMKTKINTATKGIKDKTVRIEVKAGGKLVGYKVKGGTIPVFATGGIVPGYTPGRDNQVIAVGGGEAILRPEFTRALGEDFINKGNRAAKHGGAPAVAKQLGVAGDPGGMGVKGFAGGGIVAKGSVTGTGQTVAMIKSANVLYEQWATQIGKKAAAYVQKMLVPKGAAGALKAARSQIGVPYSWGGGGPHGKSRGFAQGANTIGFDCSSLMQYAWYQATKKIMPRTTYTQRPWLRRISKPVPGAVGQPNPNHTFMSAGNGRVVEAAHTGTRIRERSASAGFWGLPPWKMDDGGILTPGSTAVNMTREPEAVFTRKQWDTQGSSGGGDTITIIVKADATTDRAALGKALYESLKEYKRRSKPGGSLNL